MRTSCRFAMAVHVMTVLAHKDGDPVTSQFLAASVNTHPVIIRRLLLALQKAGLVETRKGAGFGSRLSQAPGRIHLAHIFKAVEENPPFAMPTKKPNESCPVGKCIRAALQTVFSSAEHAMEKELGRTRLSDILDLAHQECGDRIRPTRAVSAPRRRVGLRSRAV